MLTTEINSIFSETNPIIRLINYFTEKSVFAFKNLSRKFQLNLNLYLINSIIF